MRQFDANFIGNSFVEIRVELILSKLLITRFYVIILLKIFLIEKREKNPQKQAAINTHAHHKNFITSKFLENKIH
jgi:hypothetical protein